MALPSPNPPDRAAADAVVVAMHTDLIGDIAERHHEGEQAVLARRHAALFRDAGVRCICDHVIGETFETQSFPSRALLEAVVGGKPYNASYLKHSLRNLTYVLRDLDESRDAFGLATTVGDIRAIAAQDRIAVVLSTQGVSPLEDEPSLLDIYYRLGVRVLGLVTIRGNAAVGSSLANPHYGLSALGRTFVAAAQRLRMVVDVSAISSPGFWDVMKLVDGPVIASHSNAYGVCDYPSNLTDDQLKALGACGGVVGLIANGKLVSRKARSTLADFVDHIDYIADRVGIEHVAIGPDIVEDTFYPIEVYRRMFGEHGFWSAAYPDGLSSHRDLPAVRHELTRRGYSPADIDLVLGENVLRVYAQVWGEGTP